MDVHVRSNTVRLLDKPKVLTAQYNHPFVWESGDICYNGAFDRFRDEGVLFSVLPTSTPKERMHAANMIATAMNVARKVMQQAYYGKLNPVKALSLETFRKEFQAAMITGSQVKVYGH